MVNAKDLRDIFEDIRKEATRRAGDALDGASVGRRDRMPGLLIFIGGLALGTLIGLVAASLATPYSGKQARAKLTEQMDRVRRQREEMVVGANGGATYSASLEPEAGRPGSQRGGRGSQRETRVA